MVKSFDELNLNNAFLFAAALQDEETCRLILEIILGRPVPKVNVRVEEALMYNSDLRSVRLDVYASDELQVGYDLEMQNEGKPLLPKRSRFYQSEMDMFSLKPGEGFEDLKPCYVIFICTFDPFDRKLYRYTFKNRCNEADFPLGDESYKIFLNTKGENDGEVPKLLTDFLHYVEDSTQDCADKAGEVGIRKLHARVSALKKSRKWRAVYMTIGELLDKKEARARAEGEARGENRVLALMSAMRKDGEADRIEKLSEDAAFLEEMYKKYNL